MPREHSGRSRGRRTGQGHAGVWWAWLAALVVGFGVLATGSVDPVSRALLFGGLWVAAVGAWLDPVGQDDPRANQVVLAGAMVLPALVLGLLPLPAAVRGVVSDVVTGAASGWAPIAPRPDRVLDAVALWAGLVGAAYVAARWASRGASRRPLEAGLAWATAGVAALAGLHGVMGWSTYLGLLEVRAPYGTFWAPMVNPNHTGTLLVLGFPFVLRGLRRAWRDKAIGSLLGLGATAAFVLAYPWLSSCVGLVVALAAQGALAVWWSGAPRNARMGSLALGALGSIGLAVTVAWTQPAWWRLTGGQRILQWTDSLGLWGSNPLVGVGAGNYGVAYAPVQSVAEFAAFDHAHHDLLEWAVETGLVGVLCLAVAVWWWPASSASSRSKAWWVAAAGAGAHGLVDFPLALPGLAVVVAGVLTIASVGFDGVRRDGGGRRQAVVVWLAVFALGTLWTGARGVEDRVAAQVLDLAEDPGAHTAGASLAADLHAWAPWRGEPHVYLLKATPAAERGPLRDHVAQAHRHDPDLLRWAALQAHDDGDGERADALLTLAVAGAPQDFRGHWLAAQWLWEAGDGMAAAERLAVALRTWPRTQMQGGAPLEVAFKWLPLGSWWLEALEDAPAHWNLRLAWRLLEEGEPELALVAAARAGAHRPEAFQWVGVAAEAMVAAGDRPAAEAYVADWLDHIPNNPWAWATRAKLAEADGELFDALGAWMMALAHKPGEARFVRQSDRLAERLRDTSQDAAVAEVLATATLRPDVQLAVARVREAQQRGDDCLRRLGESRLLQHPVLAEVAEAVAVRCRKL